MDNLDRAIGVASKFRGKLNQEDMLSLAKAIQRAIKSALEEDRRDRVDEMTRRLETLLRECDELEAKLRIGEDEAPEEIVTWNGYKSWRRMLVDELYRKRGEYRELKLSRHAVSAQKRTS